MTKSIHENDHEEVDLAISAQTSLERESSAPDNGGAEDQESTQMVMDALERLATSTDEMADKVNDRFEEISKQFTEGLQAAREELAESGHRDMGNESSIRQALADGLDTIIEQTGRTVGKEMGRVSESLTEQLEDIGGRVDDQLTKTDERMREVADGLEERFNEQMASSAQWQEKLAERIDGFDSRFEKVEEGWADQNESFQKMWDSSISEMRDHGDAMKQEICKEIASLHEKFDAVLSRIDALSDKWDTIADQNRDQILKGQREMVSDLAEGIALAQTTMEGSLNEFQAVLQKTEAEGRSRWESWEKTQSERLSEISEESKEVAKLGKRLEDEHGEMMQLFEQERERASEVEAERKRDRARRINNSGVARYHSGDFEQARQLFEKAVEFDHTFAEAYNNLGLALTELGVHEDATVAFETAIELNPELGAGYNNLGYVLYLQENYEAAIEMYKEAIGNQHDTSSAYTNLGNAYQKLGETEKAVDAWRKAEEIDPTNERAKHYLERFAGGVSADASSDDSE